MSEHSNDELAELVAAHNEELVAFRRHLHAHPERSSEEHGTTEAVAERLRVAGLDPRVLPCGTGLVCAVPGRDPNGPVVALRADLDALAMDDEKDVPYRSQTPGVAHACGHDVHTTVVLGAGLALAKLLQGPEAPAGSVRLLFQPAEETAPGGALDVIAAGGVDGLAMIFGLHCDPKLDVGTIGTRADAITSAADLVTLRLHGPGGHTARPQLTVDLVAVAGRIASDLPTALRAADPALSLVFGALHAGDAANVIPAVAMLRGTLRTPDRDAWNRAPKMLEQVTGEVVDPTGATWRLDHERGVPPVVNDAAATALLTRAVRTELGDEGAVGTPQSAGGDDFSWYLEHVPGSYARLGVHDPASNGPRQDLHASTFDVDERSIGVGVRVLARAALDALSARPG